MPKGQYPRSVTRSNSQRIIGRAEIKAAQAQAAERTRMRRFWRNVGISVGLVVLYCAIAWLAAHVGAK